jgi:hypothetical protein
MGKKGKKTKRVGKKMDPHVELLWEYMMHSPSVDRH